MSSEAISKYKEKLRNKVLDGEKGSSYPVLKKLCSKPGGPESSLFHLPEHVEKGLNAEQCAEIIVEHFSSISQEYDALTIYSLPPNIRSYLENINYDSIPLLTPQTV